MKNKSKSQFKYVIISGGLGFLGIYISELLIMSNFKVIILDKQKPKSEKQIKIVKKCFLYKKIDITKEKKISNFFLQLKNQKINVEYLINNAAIDSIPKNTKKNTRLPDIKDWNNELSVSLNGTYLLIKYFGEEMAKNKKGKIINIGSDLSVLAPNQDLYKDFNNFYKPPTYSVIKHGMLGMTKYFASLYSDSNVHVNMLSPGPIFNKHKKKFVNRLKKFIPLKRMANKKDLEDAILFLLSSNNNYFTGQNLIVDGGRTII